METGETKSTFIPPFPNEVMSAITPLDDLVLSMVNPNIEALSNLAGLLPDRYHWRYRTAEAFKSEMVDLSKADPNPSAINKLYWTDSLKNIEAHTVMSVWRMAELARSAVWAVARRDRICAALIARAALESAVQYLHFARTISKTILPNLEHDFKNAVLVSVELEDYLLKTVFASRLPTADKIYNPTNILTILGQVAKAPGQNAIQKNYELLCEVAHPNFIGRSIYILDTKPGPRAGDEIRIIGHGSGPSSAAILAATVWAISWATGTQVSETRLLQDTIRRTMSALPNS